MVALSSRTGESGAWTTVAMSPGPAASNPVISVATVHTVIEFSSRHYGCQRQFAPRGRHTLHGMSRSAEIELDSAVGLGDSQILLQTSRLRCALAHARRS